MYFLPFLPSFFNVGNVIRSYSLNANESTFAWIIECKKFIAPEGSLTNRGWKLSCANGRPSSAAATLSIIPEMHKFAISGCALYWNTCHHHIFCTDGSNSIKFIEELHNWKNCSNLVHECCKMKGIKVSNFWVKISPQSEIEPRRNVAANCSVGICCIICTKMIMTRCAKRKSNWPDKVQSVVAISIVCRFSLFIGARVAAILYSLYSKLCESHLIGSDRRVVSDTHVTSVCVYVPRRNECATRRVRRDNWT